jgi:hypothetical protein
MHVAVLRLLDRSSGSERERMAAWQDHARFTMSGTTLATTDTPLPRRWIPKLMFGDGTTAGDDGLVRTLSEEERLCVFTSGVDTASTATWERSSSLRRWCAYWDRG